VISRRALLASTATLSAAAPKPLIVYIGDGPKGTRSFPASGPLTFPPAGTAYRENAEAHRVWRGIHALAPSLVVDPAGHAGLAAALEGKVPVVREMPKGAPKLSPMAIARAANLKRTPREVAGQMGQVYGHELKEVAYIPAFACMGRVRLGALRDIEALAAPYINGQRNSLDKATSSHLSGHLIFAQLYEMTKNPVYLQRVKAAADMAFHADGSPKESMPLHNEMSDSVFMGCPILAQAGKLTGEKKYGEMAVTHLKFMQKLCLRNDGIYRHSPLDAAAWGRGNAFPALGMALTLEAMPDDEYVRESFQNLMAAVQPLQDADGMWHQVIDKPASYAEYSCTAMIATSMRLAIRNKWIDRSYIRNVERAWSGIKARTEPGGVLLDVCESTGKQKSETDYFHRAAVWGKDPRGGAMALLISTHLF